MFGNIVSLADMIWTGRIETGEIQTGKRYGRKREIKG